jgi:transcriptional regulator GlxA family with amidase domain
MPTHVDSPSLSFTMTRQERQYQTIVDQALVVARGEDAPVRIAEICRAIHIGRRTLLRAFRAICHDTPSHYLHALRLRTARQMLSSTDSAATSVTEVATQCGFAELGRFAAVYRSAFGEYPSATLRRSSKTRARRASGGAARICSGASRRHSKPSRNSARTDASCASNEE